VTAKEQDDFADEAITAVPLEPRSAVSTDGTDHTNGRDKSMEGDEISDGGKQRKRNKMKGWAWVEDPAGTDEVQSHEGNGFGTNGQISEAPTVVGSDEGIKDVDAADIGRSSPRDSDKTERVSVGVSGDGMDLDA
jgi:hypothetical protein